MSLCPVVLMKIPNLCRVGSIRGVFRQQPDNRVVRAAAGEEVRRTPEVCRVRRSHTRLWRHQRSWRCWGKVRGQPKLWRHPEGPQGQAGQGQRRHRAISRQVLNNRLYFCAFLCGFFVVSSQKFAFYPQLVKCHRRSQIFTVSFSSSGVLLASKGIFENVNE